MGKVGRDGEPKAASGGVTGGVGLVEAVEEPRSIDAGRARYRVLDRDGGLSSVRELHEDPRRIRAVAHGVGNEILQDAGEGIRIGQDDELSPRGLVGHAEFRLPTPFLEFRVMAYQHAFDKRAKRDGLHVERKVGVGGLGVGEELVEQSVVLSMREVAAARWSWRVRASVSS